MTWRIEHPDFQHQRLELTSPGLFSGSTLHLNGEEPPKGEKKGHFEVEDDHGISRHVELKRRLDPAPNVIVDDAEVTAAPALAAYEYAWCAAPFVLVFMGGAIGGGLGAMAAIANLNLFRTMEGPLRWIATAALSGFAVVGWIVLGSLLHFAMNS